MRYFKEFCRRGLMFGGFGPIVFGIVCLFIDPTFRGLDLFIGIISTYLIAFVQAGISVVNEVDSLSTVKAMGLHFIALYTTYTLCYLVNSWIPFNIDILVIYTVIFVVAYFITWLIVYIIIKNTTKHLNMKLK